MDLLGQANKKKWAAPISINIAINPESSATFYAQLLI